MNSPWLSETSSEGAVSAILLGPLEESVLSSEAEAYSKGVLWIAPPTENFSSSYPANVHCLDRSSESKKLSETIDEFLRLDYDNPPTVKVSSHIAEDDENAYAPILDLVISSIDSTLRARRTRSDTGVLRQEQVFRNLAGYLRSRIPEKWRDSAQGNLAVVVGAGPSLDVTLPLIKEGFPKPLVVAADSALRALKDAGVDPDFVVSIDPEKSHDSCTSIDHRPGIAILSTQSHSSWPQRWGENVRYLSGRVMTEDWLATKGIPKTSLLAVNNAGLAAMLVAEFLGPAKFYSEVSERSDEVGVATGLAATAVGGEILFIEATRMKGRKNLILTGQLGEVMQESIKASWSYVRSRAVDFGIEPPLLGKRDVHVHVPEGAIPKDGPSAGIAITTSIVSVLTGIPVKSALAMTGEVTLRGRVLPIGGLKEKLLAALRGGLKTVLFPKENEKDLAEIPENVKKGLELIPVSTVDEVLELALSSPVIPIEWVEVEAVSSVGKGAQQGDQEPIITH